MTQEHIIGEFSELIAQLAPTAAEPLAAAVHRLRRRVECSPVAALPPLAVEATALADMICWATLDEGDTGAFANRAMVAAELHQFAVSAHLLP